jgi:spermidine dehydrogenase
MKDKITRRDFLNGAALSVAATALAPYSSFAISTSVNGKEYYPPLLTGMRGSHKGSFEVAHALVMGGQRPEQYEPLDDIYDLVIVGGGISGLSAAYLYQQQMGPDVRILVLDNHDDFGGHAKRNEFESSGKMLLGPGGSLNLEKSAFSPAAYQVLEDIGVDFQALQDAGPDDYVLSNAAAPYGIYLNKNLYGKDTIISGDWGGAWAGAGDYKSMIKSLDLSENDTNHLITLASGEKDYLSDIPLSGKEAYTRNTSYATFLYEKVGLSKQGAKITEPWVRAIWGVGINSASIMEALELGAPGANAMGFPESEEEADAPEDPNAYRSPIFPDGNASVARLFVNKLIPQVARADSMEEVIASRFDYSQLDVQDAPVRIRLNSTVVNVANRGSELVDISYVSGDRAFKVQGRHCILAGYNGMIPHLCPDLSEAQKENLAYGSKIPFICANVVLKTSAPVRKSGASLYLCADSFFELVTHAPPVNLGAYQVSIKSEDPMVMFMLHMPAPEGNDNQSGRDLCRLGRHNIMATSFADYEKQIRTQLSGMFGEAGFDADRDIEAITINRWSHGYAYEYMDLHDPRWEPGQAPHELGRQPFGRISIANSDSEAYAYVQSAIDASIRAVREVVS